MSLTVIALRKRANVKPIETIYRMHHFRSRLEARWAVFFDSLGVTWEYEKEGYNLGLKYGRYLPDFWIPHICAWIEIKGEKPSDREDKRHQKFVELIHQPLYVFTGQIHRYALSEFSESCWVWDWMGEHVGWDIGHLWCECPICGQVGIEFEGRAARLSCSCLNGDKERNPHSIRIMTAYKAAIAVRFENHNKGQRNPPGGQAPFPRGSVRPFDKRSPIEQEKKVELY